SWAHGQNERAPAVRLSADVGVGDAVSVKHVVRHVHGARAGNTAHDPRSHLGNSPESGTRIRGSAKSLGDFLVPLLRVPPTRAKRTSSDSGIRSSPAGRDEAVSSGFFVCAKQLKAGSRLNTPRSTVDFIPTPGLILTRISDSDH